MQDILEELPEEALASLRPGPPGSPPAPPLAPAEREILGLLPVDDACPIDTILEISRMDVAKLSEVLLHLEIKGWVRQLPGRRFCRNPLGKGLG